MLDPQASYIGLKNAAKSNEQLLELIDKSKVALEGHFLSCYASLTKKDDSANSNNSNSHSSSTYSLGTLFGGDVQTPHTELDEYFSMSLEKMDCEPVKWWVARRAQFPSLSLLARDIHSIPGTILII